MDPDVRHAAFEDAYAEANGDPAAAGNTAVDLAVDLAGERPSQTSHGLRPDKVSRWLGGAMLGTAFVTIAIVSAVRSTNDDHDVAAREVPLLEAQLAEPLSFAVISLERVRVEWITTEILRTLDRPLARASKRMNKTPVHAAAVSPSGSTRRASPKLSDLPAPQLDAPVDPPADAQPAAPVADAPPADAPAEPAAPLPSPPPLPTVDAPEPDLVDEEV